MRHQPEPYPPGTPELARYCGWWPLGTLAACYAPADELRGTEDEASD